MSFPFSLFSSLRDRFSRAIYRKIFLYVLASMVVVAEGATIAAEINLLIYSIV